jgi:hypothetical protein
MGYNGVYSVENQSTFRKTLNIEAIYSSETSFDFHRTTRCHIPEDLQFNYISINSGNGGLEWFPSPVRSNVSCFLRSVPSRDHFVPVNCVNNRPAQLLEDLIRTLYLCSNVRSIYQDCLF